MQNLNQTDSSTINYPNQNNQQLVENAVKFGSEMNNSTSDETLAILDSTSYQSDSNSAFFNCSNAGNSVDFNHMQVNNNFTYNDKYSNSYANQIVDEISQTSLTSTCSSQLDDSLTSRQQSMIKISPFHLNQLKSVPEEDSLSQQSTYQNSTLKPQLFSSPINTGKAKVGKRKNESIEKLYTMSNEPDRKEFLDKLIKFNTDAGITMLVCPNIAKNLIDLYRVYYMVKERGGFVEVCKNTSWKEIAEICGFPITSTTAYSLRKKYTKFILPYECKYDRDEVDPESIILQTDVKNKRSNRSKKQQTSSPTNSINNNSQQDIPMNYLSQQLPKGTNNNQQSSFNNQPNYSNKQMPSSPLSVKPMQYTNQMIYNNGYEQQQQQIQMQKNVYLEDQQYINQMSQDQMMNYDPNLYSSNNQQILMNQDFNNSQQYYSQYESDYHNSPNQLHKSASVVSGQTQYYSDPNQYNNVNNYTYDQMQYSNYNNAAATSNFPQDMNLYTDSSRMSNTNTVNSRMNMPGDQQQQQFSASKQYQFTANTNAYDYAQPQLNNRTSQTNYSNIAYQNSPSRVQQPYIIENVNLVDSKQQYNQIENWPANNCPTSNWPNQNCYSAQVSISSQQQQPIESPIQTKTFSNNNNLIHTRPPTVHHQALLSTAQLKQQNIYYQNNVSSTNKFLAQQNNSNVLPMQQQQTNQQNAFNTTSFNQMHQAQSNLVAAKNFLARDIDFPADCIESVQPDFIPKRKLTVKDLQNYDIPKLIMSLKSGLLGESTQALNALSIIAGDDSAYNHVKLAKHPGFLKLLLKYFRAYLNELFSDIFISDQNNNNDKINMNDYTKKETINQTNFDNNNLIKQTVICNRIDNSKLSFDKQQEFKFIHLISTEDTAEVRTTIKDDSFILTSLHPKRKTPEKANDEQDLNDEYNIKTKHLKGNFLEDYENEAKVIEVDPFCTISEFKEDNNQRCICVSTIIRNLSFVHGNEQELSNDHDLIFIISKILLYSHKHNEKKVRNLNLNQATNEPDNLKEKKIEQNKETWWFEALNIIQENALVTLTNMAASLNFNDYQEELSLPILEGLLHWALCPSSAALDNFTSTSIKSCSPKRLALECLSKLSILESNVDLLLATPPLSHNSKAFTRLTDLLSKCEQQIIREFALVILSNFVMADQNIATAICCSTDIVQQLICYLEQYRDNLEQQQLKEHQTYSNHINVTTTLDMAKRAATCLNHLAKVPENNQHFFIHQEKLIQLATSSVLDQSLSKMISEIAFEYSSYEALANQQLELQSTNDPNSMIQTNTLPDSVSYIGK